MSSNDLIARFNSDVAQVQHRTDDCFGSGRLVAPSLVLTARHVLEDNKKNVGKDGWQIRLHREYQGSAPNAPKWEWRDAIVAWEKAGIDIALLQVTGYKPVPTLPVVFSGIAGAAVDLAAAPGFPRATKTTDERLIYRAGGKLTEQSTYQSYRLAVPWEIAAAKADLWRGISGAAATVFCDVLPDPLPVFGVMEQVDPANFTPGMIQVARIDAALREPSFCDVLQRALGYNPKLGLYPTATVSPLAKIPAAERQCLLDILYTFDRQDEASRVTAYVAPGPVEIIVCGLADDAHDLFAQRLRREALAADGAAEIELPLFDWPQDESAGSERLRIAHMRLSQALTGATKLEITSAEIKAALKIPDTPSWVVLRIVGSKFSPDDTRDLIKWRELWHNAAKDEPLPPCGVIYAIEDLATLSDPLTKALDIINKRKPHLIVLPECEDRMLERWPSHLEMFAKRRRISKDSRPIKAAQSLHRALMNQQEWKRFRLRNLEQFLS